MASTQPQIIALRSAETSTALLPLVVEGLLKTDPISVDAGEDGVIVYSKTLPTIALYSDEGLRIYEEITKLREYYPFEAEREILEKFGDDIARSLLRLPPATAQQDAGSASAHHQDGAGIAGLVVELGAGPLAKTRYLLESFGKLLKSSPVISEVKYLALDLERVVLEETLSLLAEQSDEFVSIRRESGKVMVAGLNATYEEGLAWLETQGGDQREGRSPLEVSNVQDLDENATFPSQERDRSQTGSLASSGSSATPSFASFSDDDQWSPSLSMSTVESAAHRTSLLWLGASIGNLSRDEARDFLANVARNVLKPGDTILVGIDGCTDGKTVRLAYNDPAGVTRRFILTGVDTCGAALCDGQDATELRAGSFDYVSRWNGVAGRHEAYVRAKRDVTISLPATEDATAVAIPIKEEEHLAIEVSYKYTAAQANSLFDGAGLKVIKSWTDQAGWYTLYLLDKAL